jgi:predicted kinase
LFDGLNSSNVIHRKYGDKIFLIDNLKNTKGNQMKLIVLRGVSGSGKTTKANELKNDFLGQSPGGLVHICSADDFFVNPKTREYKFDGSKLSQAHAWCKGRAYAAMSLGADLVIVDNTNTRKWEYQSYLDMAELFGYEVEECVVGDFDDESLLVYAERCVHGVPFEHITKMANRFEYEITAD